jgi:hypothetical protein
MRIVLAAALAAGLCSCQKPQPSPEYQQARQRYAALQAQYPLEARERPEMDEVLSLLERVPRDSADTEAAAALREAILGERRALAEERARRAKLVESAGNSAAWAAGSSVSAGGAAGGEAAIAGGGAPRPEGPPGAEAGGQGGPGAPARPPSRLAAGTALADFQKAQGDCFEARAPARIGQREGKPLEGEAWALKESDACKKAHPDEVGRLLLFAEGKLVEVREVGEGKATPVTQAIKGVAGRDGAPALPPGTKLPPGATVQWSAPAPTGKAPPGSPPPAAPPSTGMAAGSPPPAAPQAPAAPVAPAPAK